MRHTQHFERLAAPREICTGFAPVLDAEADRLSAIGARWAATDLVCEGIGGLLPDAERCGACAVALGRARTASESIAAGLRNDAARMATLSAICLPHLARVAARLPTAIGKALLRRQSELLRRLADDMRRFALKQDAAKRFLASREELAAGQRGLRALIGDPEAAVSSAAAVYIRIYSPPEGAAVESEGG